MYMSMRRSLIVGTDPGYKKAFKAVFGVQGNKLTMDYVAKAIASFERYGDARRSVVNTMGTPIPVGLIKRTPASAL